jgi:hypothetical protein
MPYIKFLNEKKQALPLLPIDMARIDFRVTAARVPGAGYTFVNANQFISDIIPVYGIAMYLGVCEDVDTPPFAVVPLAHTRYMRPGDSLAIAPGSLTLDMTYTGPGRDDYTKPDDAPPDEGAESRVARRLTE